jgi:hypothetical protein
MMTLVNNQNIVWLASYPKSGNTWFRAFLTALLSKGNQININNLVNDYSHADARLFEHATEQNASELHLEEIDDLKPDVIEYFANQTQNDFYIKIHEKLRYLPNNKLIIPIHKTKTVIYIIRNPLDVCVSYAHHDNTSIDSIIKRMNNSNFTLAKVKNFEFFNIPEVLGTWSEHALSWCEPSNNLNIEVIRYEDLHLKTVETFTRAVKAIGYDYSSLEIKNAIEQSSFDKLKQQELNSAFKEKNPASTSFFRQGKIGSWREKLNKKQINIIINNHYKVMRSFGYLTQTGHPVF